ncbi:hypothetical protein [Methylocystis parvus]|uniref:Thaumatin family protein n=1 Tax=Methylocystis parvus TaxID=134 RepID=A0A6B8M5M4_9HYPH|nr:hypothetical protein [Methylocystis parvus]QGM97645.1 hypothetical protein F7D14_09340 [Methylocystis parvus]WBJ98420.1 hypothetical protein MMG94_10250 [Methylocystis parvus OBBP]
MPSVLARTFALLAIALGGHAPPAYAQNVGAGLMDASLVAFVNRSQRTLYIGFSPQPGRPAPFSWSPDCRRINGQVVLPPGQTCAVSVPPSAGASRFCAMENLLPPGKTPDCFAAQRDNLTIIEANFASREGCARLQDNPESLMRSCVWYDVNVSPEGCTNAEWSANLCAQSGGAAYNVPVQLFCAGQPTFTCQGPPATTGAKYPLKCGAPGADCVGGVDPACQQAYFFPMSTSGPNKYPASKPQPIARCPEGQKLFVIFPEGP